MKIWQMDKYPIGDPRLPHHLYPPKLYTTDQLHTLLGVISYKVLTEILIIFQILILIVHFCLWKIFIELTYFV